MTDDPWAPGMGDRIAPSLAEVLKLVARGRELAFTTGSPVAFRTSDGVTCVITFEPAVLSGWPPLPAPPSTPDGGGLARRATQR